MWVRHCRTCGILGIGKLNPESVKSGLTTKKLSDPSPAVKDMRGHQRNPFGKDNSGRDQAALFIRRNLLEDAGWSIGGAIDLLAAKAVMGMR